MSTYAYQPSTPGREGPSGPPPTTTSTAPAEGGGAPPPGQPSTITMMLPMLIMVVLLFFFTSRSSKKQKQLESNLKTGDTVVTQSGMIGKITEFIGETRVKVEIAPGVSVRMLKSSISGVDGGEAKPADAKDKPQDKPQEKKA